MKTRYLVLAVTVVCLAGGTLAGFANDQAPAERRTPGLDQLLERIEALEARVRQLEQRQAVVAIPQPRRLTPQVPYQQGETVPRSWTRKEFNGQYYYLVPLDSHDKAIPPTEHAR